MATKYEPSKQLEHELRKTVFCTLSLFDHRDQINYIQIKHTVEGRTVKELWVTVKETDICCWKETGHELWSMVSRSRHSP